MCYGYLLLLLSFWLLFLAERCRRSPEWCKKRFMGDSGIHRSFVAMRFTGYPKEAQAEYMRNPELRRAFIIERYAWVITSLILGIGAIIWGK